MESILFLLVAGFANAVMDTLVHHFSTSVFRIYTTNRWYNPMLSYDNRHHVTVHILHLLPEQLNRKIVFNIIAFLVSTTFVWLTDLWHFAKFFMVVCIGLSVYTGGMNPLVGYVIFSVSFEISYRYILRREP
jgi:hypothetical protein